MSTPIEVTTRYVTSVGTLPEAWAFVMERLDMVGPDPTIRIEPKWVISPQDMDRDEDWPRLFEVCVEGMVEES